MVVNLKLIREKIDAKGLKLKRVAELMNLSRLGLTKKLQGENEFKVSEALKLSEILGFKKEEIEEIFFN